MYRASIDIGSNTILLLIGEVKSNKIIKICDESRVTGLGKSIDFNQRFTDKSMRESLEALSEYHFILDKYGIESQNAIVTATEASRVARNSGEFFQKVKDKFGFETQVITSDGEAYYTALGVKVGGVFSEDNKVLIMDIGGASTELINVQVAPFKIIESISLPVGSVRATEWESLGQFAENLEIIVSDFNLANFKTKKLLGVAGTMTLLSAMFLELKEFDGETIHGTQIDFQKYCDFCEELERSNPTKIQDKYKYAGKRAFTIQAGTKLGKYIGKELNVRALEISNFGLRHGTLYSGRIDEKFR